MVGRAIDNKLTDFGHQYAQRISNATGGSEWYKQSNPFMNVALESMNAPQLAATYAVTGKVQTPSEAMDIQNPYGAFVVDALLDPAVAFGVGKGLARGFKKIKPKSILGEFNTVSKPDFDIHDVRLKYHNNVALTTKKSTQYHVDTITNFLNKVDVTIKHGSKNGCYYSPSGDYVQMVNKEDFIDTKDANATEHYYSVLFHELVHATGHNKRLNRFEDTKSMKFLEGKSHYAYEELVAELGSMLFASKYNLSVESTVREDHIAYLQSWIKALRSEDGTKLLTSAAAKAAAAFKYYHQSQL
jgi:hypothetical protein